MGIINFKHRGLKRFYNKDDTSKIQPEHAERLIMILDALAGATQPDDLRALRKRWHPLKGNRRGQYAVDVDRNTRVTYGWKDGDAIDVDYEDYH